MNLVDNHPLEAQKGKIQDKNKTLDPAKAREFFL